MDADEKIKNAAHAGASKVEEELDAVGAAQATYVADVAEATESKQKLESLEAEFDGEVSDIEKAEAQLETVELPADAGADSEPVEPAAVQAEQEVADDDPFAEAPADAQAADEAVIEQAPADGEGEQEPVAQAAGEEPADELVEAAEQKPAAEADGPVSAEAAPVAEPEQAVEQQPDEAKAPKEKHKLDKSLVSVILILALVAVIGAAGLAYGALQPPPTLEATTNLPNTLEAGTSSIEYPGGYEVYQEYVEGYSTGSLTDDIAIKGMAVALSSGNDRMIELMELDDPDKTGLKGVEGWIDDQKKEQKELKENYPSMEASVDYGDYERVTVNGHECLLWTVYNASYDYEYLYLFVEKDGAVSTCATIAVSKATYDAKPDYYKGILGTVSVA